MRPTSNDGHAGLFPADRTEPRTPLPVRMVASEEYAPIRQTNKQREAEGRLFVAMSAGGDGPHRKALSAGGWSSACHWASAGMSGLAPMGSTLRWNCGNMTDDNLAKLQ